MSMADILIVASGPQCGAFFFSQEGILRLSRGKLDSAETERPRAVAVDLSEAFWTSVLLLTKPSDSSPFGVVAGSSLLILWGRVFLSALPIAALKVL